jgi:hypothetical protein
MSAVPDYDSGWPCSPPPSDLGGLLDAASAAVGQLADKADPDVMADRDAVAIMGALTTLVGRLDGPRVQVARRVRDRDICGLRGARNLAGWLRADARLADDAWKLARLAAVGPDLPQITALLGAGTISLAQAATACWQIAQLPAVPVPPPVIDGEAAAGRPDGDAQASQQDRPGQTGRPGDVAGSSPAGESLNAGELPAGVDPCGGEGWAGLWRAGDVHAAADELFAAFLPALDGAQLRQLGAHLREAADTQDRAADARDDYARRGLRISRSLHGTGEITGRLHAEAAEQVTAAFGQLGRKTGPDDMRTKAQRWADVLTRLAGTAPNLPAGSSDPAGPVPDPAGPVPDPAGPVPDPAGPAPDPAGPAPDPAGPGDDPAGPGDDQPDDTDPHTGHDHHQDEHRHRHRSARPGGPVPAGFQRPRIIVTVPLDTLLGRPLAPGATLGSGTPLTAEAAWRLACDAGLIRLITAPYPPPDRRQHSHGDHSVGDCDGGHSDGGDCDAGGGTSGHKDATAQLTRLLAEAIAGLPPPLAGPSAMLDIGRQSPGWTPRQRDALHAQYGGHCGFGRCDGPIDVIHHIIHWLHGGKTRITNGFPCCLYHHWLIHEGGWRISKRSDGTITTIPPPPGWKPGTIYRHGKPVTERTGTADTS